MPLSNEDMYKIMGPSSVAPDELYKFKPLAKWVISKDFNFCYGHRVFNQHLNKEYSLDTACKCRHYHGHEGLIRVSLQAKYLKNGMVTDFKHLNWFKKWLDEELDHKFIMGLEDPLLPYDAPLAKKENISRHEAGHYTVNPKIYYNLETCLQEKYQGLVFVDFVPTSENLAKWLFEYIEQKMSKIEVQILSVQFYETPKSQSIYTLI